MFNLPQFCDTTIPSLVAKLKLVRSCLVIVLLASVKLPAAQAIDVAPDAAEQRRLLEKVRESASHFLESLPNFVCSRVTEQYQAGKKPEHWKQRETLSEKLLFNQGKENVSLELLNGKPLPPHRFVERPLETSGEFGELLHNILDKKTQAAITWNRWENVNGRRLAVFDYVIDAAHSKISVSLDGLDLIVPYRGFLYAEPTTGDLWRITSSPFSMPPALETKSVTTTIDYGPVTISNKQFLLPVSATIAMDTGTHNLLNKISFNQYRKFEADSKITFVSGSN